MAATLLLTLNLAILITLGSIVLDEGIPDEIDYLRDTVGVTARTFSAVAGWGLLYVPALVGVSLGFGFFASRSTSRWVRRVGLACALLTIALAFGNVFMGTLWWSFGS